MIESGDMSRVTPYPDALMRKWIAYGPSYGHRLWGARVICLPGGPGCDPGLGPLGLRFSEPSPWRTLDSLFHPCGAVDTSESL